jgi:pilus assembly protein CpaC
MTKRAASFRLALSVFALLIAFSAYSAAVAKPLSLEVGEEKFISSQGPTERISVGDQKVLDVQVIDEKTIRLLGLAAGTTSLTIWRKGSHATTMYQVSVTPPLASLQKQLEANPNLRSARVVVQGGKVVLYGRFADEESRKKALAITKYLTGADVLDMTELSNQQVVQVDVQFATIATSTLESLGINFSSLGHGFSIAGSAPSTLGSYSFNESGKSGLQVDTRPALANAFNLLLASPNSNILTVISALKSANLAHTLTKPSLLVHSGHSASFIVGGEIPIPVPQNNTSGSIGIEYKKFGVQLNVEPTILPNKMVSLDLNPEVSELDYANALQISGFTIPALKTRSATTSVDVPAGHTLILAGLMYQTQGSIKERLPYLSDLPLLGELFKRTQKTGERQELVVAVTPHLVDTTSNTTDLSHRYGKLLASGVTSATQGASQQIDQPGLMP